ncbi:MAG: NAD-dependent deacetylase sirtuin 4 [Bradymonadia bacterium]|jgi:NAD-dependent deacetylase sirtuin 4
MPPIALDPSSNAGLITSDRARRAVEESLLLLPTPAASVVALAERLRRGGTMVLAGAGCSTESGIPDYRGPIGSRRERNPIQFLPFVRKESVRQRYWTRSVIGWPALSECPPNSTHFALAELEGRGVTTGLVSQNVDGLHQAAGHQELVELHGSLSRVRCLSCYAAEHRDDYQQRLLKANPRVAEELPAGDRNEIAPDGDAEVDESTLSRFVIPSCLRCGGIMKPDVVFFGENVPPHVTDRAISVYEQADHVLVVGSSLTVWSGFRFVKWAAEAGKAVSIMTLGPTRGDSLASLNVQARLGDALPRLVQAL